MRASIDRTNCISCGLCTGICPEVFQMADDNYAEVYVDTIPSEVEASALEAKESCPVSIITIE